MKNQEHWKPSKFEWKRGRLRGSRNANELGIGSRLVADLVAAQYQANLQVHARGRLLDLGAGKVPFYSAYRPYASEITCVDWSPGDYLDMQCDLAQPLPFESCRFDTIILSDVLEHIPEPDLLWKEMTRLLAPGGKIILNVPFYYVVHEHPHDYYRYTNFALERFIQMNGLVLEKMSAIGGVVEIIADVFAKIATKLPLMGPVLAMLIQSLAWHFSKTRWGTKAIALSSHHFPLGYFVVAVRKR